MEASRRLVVAIVAAIAMVACDRGPSLAEQRCRDGYEARRWEDAAPACTSAGSRAHPELIVLAARAWTQQRRFTEALAVAEQGFGTSVDATARQIAGSSHLQLGDRVQAHVLLVEALVLHHLAGDHAELARDYQSITGLFQHERRLTEAMIAARSSIDEAHLAGDPRLEGYAQLAAAEVFATIGDATSARTAFVAAETLLGPRPQDMAWAVLKHGIFVLLLDDADGAAQLLTQALALARAGGFATVADAAHLNLAMAEHLRGHLDEAQRHLDALPAQVRATSAAGRLAGLLAADRGDSAAAEQLLSAAAAHVVTDEYAWEIAAERGDIARRSGDLAGAETFYRAAIDIIEDVRARTAALELRPWILSHRRTPYEALFALLVAQRREPDALAIAERLHARTWLDVVASAHTPRAQHAPPDIAAAASRSISALREIVGDREVLVYVDTRGALWRFHLDGTRIVELARVPDDVFASLEAWRGHPDDRAIADQLGTWLVPRDLVASSRPLYLVAPDRLAAVAFPALRRSQRYLIEDRPLIRLPALAGLGCGTAPTESTGEPILVADSHDDLPHARNEVAHAAHATQGQAYVGAAATIGHLASAARARLLHAAVHAGVSRAGAALDLADGPLTAADIVARRIAPQVAVLAGCGTGLSDDQEGSGGLPSAFLAAGTQTVVATLRRVDDRDASSVMNAFYDADGGRHPAQGLARAQRRLAQADVPPHAWAWFAVWGKAEPSECADHTPTRTNGAQHTGWP